MRGGDDHHTHKNLNQIIVRLIRIRHLDIVFARLFDFKIGGRLRAASTPAPMIPAPMPARNAYNQKLLSLPLVGSVVASAVGATVGATVGAGA